MRREREAPRWSLSFDLSNSVLITEVKRMWGKNTFEKRNKKKKVCLFDSRPCDNDKKEVEQESSLKLSEVRAGYVNLNHRQMNVGFNNWTIMWHLNTEGGLGWNFMSLTHLEIKWRRIPSKEEIRRTWYPGIHLVRASQRDSTFSFCCL